MPAGNCNLRVESAGQERKRYALQLEIERLLLLPLRAEQLRPWAEDDPALERALGCAYEGEPMTEEPLRGIVRGQLEIVRGDGGNWLRQTFWLLVRRTDRVALGAADFKAPPDENGTVELGYGLGERHRGSGYMTEAEGALCGWVLSRSGVRRVIAETEPDNASSRCVLERCGFVLFRETRKSPWWELLREGGAAG